MTTETAKANTQSGVGTSEVQLTIDDRGLATIVIDVSGSKVNTLGRRVMEALDAALDQVAANNSVKGLVISSAKTEGGFIAGADVIEIKALREQGLRAVLEAANLGKQVFAKIAALKVPTVAAINGLSLGGGTELSLACRYRIASSKARIGLPEIKLGFVPGWGGCVRMPKLVGFRKALELIMTGKELDGKRAWKAGLVCEVVEPDALAARAAEVALGAKPKSYNRDFSEQLQALVLDNLPLGRQIVADAAHKAMMKETRGKYPAAKEVISLVQKALVLPEDKAMKVESETFAKLAMTNVSRNLVGIFFAQQDSKKVPTISQAVPKIERVGVLGAGVMGAGIAQISANKGYKVAVRDVEQRFVDNGKAKILELFNGLVAKRRIKQEEVDRIMSEMTMTTSYSDMAECDLVIEAVLEDLKIKQEAVAELEKVITKPFIFASNTSSLSIEQIAASARDKSKVVGLHFFNPVHKMPLVEVVRTKETSPETLAAALAYAGKVGKTAVITADAPGFVVNRILAPYMREAAVLAGEGVPIEDIDKAMKKFGMPMGPMALLDEVGLDVAAKVIHVLHAALGERLTPPPLLQEIEKLKLLGKKGKKGIYLYNEKGRSEGVNPDVQTCIKAAVNTKSESEIQDRLVLLMLNEACRCLEEKVVEKHAQLDLALIFGIGFPPFEGGILRWADALGIREAVDKLDYLARIHGERYKPTQLLLDKAKTGATFYGE